MPKSHLVSTYLHTEPTVFCTQSIPERGGWLQCRVGGRRECWILGRASVLGDCVFLVPRIYKVDRLKSSSMRVLDSLSQTYDEKSENI